MLVVISTADHFLGVHLSRLVRETGLIGVRTRKFERLLRELKQPGKLAIIDVKWKEVQGPGELRRLVNLARICDNQVVCICPNRDQELKNLARQARPSQVYLRYDLQTFFRNYLEHVAKSVSARKRLRTT